MKSHTNMQFQVYLLTYATGFKGQYHLIDSNIEKRHLDIQYFYPYMNGRPFKI